LRNKEFDRGGNCGERGIRSAKQGKEKLLTQEGKDSRKQTEEDR
jgi:hypothetical protein